MFFIRSAGEADLRAVLALLDRCWHVAYDGLQGSDKVSELTAEMFSEPALRARLKRPDSEFIVADDGERIGGMAYAAMVAEETDIVMLHQIYVEPELTGQGIGRDLFAEIETCFPGAKRMRLEVEPANERAIRFYKGLGFAEVGWTKNCGSPQSGIPALIFEKALAV